MKKLIMNTDGLFLLCSSGLFLRWCYLLFSMDTYLFSNSLSIAFWSTSIKRLLIAIIVSSGLIVSISSFSQTRKFISVILIVISITGSFFIAPETFYLEFCYLSVFIHIGAIFKLKDSEKSIKWVNPQTLQQQ
jgi:hypothetical protein